MNGVPTPQQRAKQIIDTKTNMTLATVDASGAPWVSPVFYVPDDAYDLYWTSWIEARHSENVRSNPAVAIVIYDSVPNEPVDAVYLAARAVELNDHDDVARGMEIMARRNDLQPEWWQIGGISEVTRVVTREPTEFTTPAP